MDLEAVHLLHQCLACGVWNRVEPARWREARCGRCGAALQMAPTELLGVPEDAPIDEVRHVFRTLAKAWHPDHRPGDPLAEARFRALLEAYREILRGKARATQRATASSAHDQPGGVHGADPAERMAAPPQERADDAGQAGQLPALYRIGLSVLVLALAVAVFVAGAWVREQLLRAGLQVAAGGVGLYAVLQMAIALWDGLHPARVGPQKG